jgi:uncharacterized protein
MKIAIISDIHDNLVNLEKCLSWCKNNKIEQLICCGDVTNSETLNYLANNFGIRSAATNGAHANEKKGIIYLVAGNAEIYEEKELDNYQNIKYYGKIGIIEINGKNIGICHEPYLIKKILERNECDIIFYGHTHKPWEEEKNGTKLINPGTLSGMFQKATFAVMEDNNLQLVLLENI